MTSEDLKKLISASINTHKIQVYSPDNKHFDVMIVSETFSEMKTIERQRKIYSIINGDILSGKIHAITLKTYDLVEWVKNENL